MSAFLGPIHYWLFNKILLIEGRAFAIAQALKDNGKATAVADKVDAYGQRMAGRELDDLVGDNPIHQFLYGMISKVEVFEAGLVEIAGAAYDSALAAVEKHGKQTGQKAVEQKGEKPDDLEAIYQYVSDYQLEGMPCDPGAEVEPGADKVLLYRHRVCNHISNWEYTSCPVDKMCAIHNAWLKGFISGLNDSASYEVKRAIADGADGCEAEIKFQMRPAHR